MAENLQNNFFQNEVYQSLQKVYTNSRTRDQITIESWLKQPPLFTTVRVNYPKDIADALQELQRIIDTIFSSRNQVPRTVYVHRQIKDLLVIPSTTSNNFNNTAKKEIIVDVHCGAAVLRGADIFAPGVISAPTDLQPNNSVSVYADLAGKCLKGFAKVYNGPKMYLGTGTAVYSRQDLFNSNSKVNGVAIAMQETLNNCPSLDHNVLGSTMFLQNLPSVVCGHVLDPKPTDVVLDMCAAPGGKTTHLASLMCNAGIIIALDKTKPRVAKLKCNIELTGYTNIHAFVFDATKALDSDATKRLDTSDDFTLQPPYHPETFDCILLDAPCSGLGQRPQLTNRLTMKELQSFPLLQQKLLSRGVELLKPGGKLVYSTCTLTLEENEKVVAWALEKYCCLLLEDQDPRIGGPGREVRGLSSQDLGKLQCFDINSPGVEEDADTIGFFIAKFRKRFV